MGSSIIVSSGKGGVGKTSVVVNVAAALSAMGKKVVLIDGSHSSPDVSLHLNVPFTVTTLHQLLDNQEQQAAPFVHDSGVHVIPGELSRRVDDLTRELPFDAFSRLMKELVERHDYVFVDPGQQDLKFLSRMKCDYVLVVGTPDLPSLVHVSNVLKVAQSNGIQIAGMVLNRMGHHVDELSKQECTPLLRGCPILGEIPEDASFLTALRQGEPALGHIPGSALYSAMFSLAEGLLEKIEGRKANHPQVVLRTDPIAETVLFTGAAVHAGLSEQMLPEQELRSSEPDAQAEGPCHTIPITQDIFANPHLDIVIADELAELATDSVEGPREDIDMKVQTVSSSKEQRTHAGKNTKGKQGAARERNSILEGGADIPSPRRRGKENDMKWTERKPARRKKAERNAARGKVKMKSSLRKRNVKSKIRAPKKAPVSGKGKKKSVSRKVTAKTVSQKPRKPSRGKIQGSARRKVTKKARKTSARKGKGLSLFSLSGSNILGRHSKRALLDHLKEAHR